MGCCCTTSTGAAIFTAVASTSSGTILLLHCRCLAAARTSAGSTSRRRRQRQSHGGGIILLDARVKTRRQIVAGRFLLKRTRDRPTDGRAKTIYNAGFQRITKGFRGGNHGLEFGLQCFQGVTGTRLGVDTRLGRNQGGRLVRGQSSTIIQSDFHGTRSHDLGGCVGGIPSLVVVQVGKEIGGPGRFLGNGKERGVQENGRSHDQFFVLLQFGFCFFQGRRLLGHTTTTATTQATSRRRAGRSSGRGWNPHGQGIGRGRIVRCCLPPSLSSLVFFVPKGTPSRHALHGVQPIQNGLVVLPNALKLGRMREGFVLLVQTGFVGKGPRRAHEH